MSLSTHSSVAWRDTLRTQVTERSLSNKCWFPCFMCSFKQTSESLRSRMGGRRSTKLCRLFKRPYALWRTTHHPRTRVSSFKSYPLSLHIDVHVGTNTVWQVALLNPYSPVPCCAARLLGLEGCYVGARVARAQIYAGLGTSCPALRPLLIWKLVMSHCLCNTITHIVIYWPFQLDDPLLAPFTNYKALAVSKMGKSPI